MADDAFVLDTRKPSDESRLVRINDLSYHVTGVTRNVAKRMVILEAKVRALDKRAKAEEEIDPDQMAHTLIEAIACRLKPENPGQQSAEALLKELWGAEDDELSIGQLQELQRILETRTEELDRPPT